MLQNEVSGKVVGAFGQCATIGFLLLFIADPHFTVIVLPDRRRKGGLVGLIMAAHVAARFSIAAEVVCAVQTFQTCCPRMPPQAAASGTGPAPETGSILFFHILLPFLSEFSCWQSKTISVFLVCKSE